jgi:hypothetical protein
MQFKVPSGEAACYHQLSGNWLSQDQIRQLALDKKVQCFVSDMKMNMTVSIDHAGDVYRLLRTGECTFGIPGITIYKIKLPIRVDDVEGKRHYAFIADLEYIDNNTIDTKA